MQSESIGNHNLFAYSGHGRGNAWRGSRVVAKIEGRTEGGFVTGNGQALGLSFTATLSFAPPHLVLATSGFIVWVNDELNIDWKSTPEWDAQHGEERQKHSAILNRAIALEAGDWDSSDEQKTLNLKMQIGQAIAQYLNGAVVQADQ